MPSGRAGTRNSSNHGAGSHAAAPITGTEMDDKLQSFMVTITSVIRKELEELFTARLKEQANEISTLKQQVADQQQEISRLREKSEVSEVLDKVIVHGLQEEKLEASEDHCKRQETSLVTANKFTKEALEIHGGAEIQRAYRLGKKQPGKHRPLVIQYRSPQQAYNTLQMKKKESVRATLQGRGIWVSEMLTPEEMKRKRALINEEGFKQAWDQARAANQPSFWRRAVPYINKVQWTGGAALELSTA